MNGASKILTVSYGTFSCTLEGFDDPFNTMKAIAEYFRDLAAGDRYFGAEPPQPDAAMLHRIAEREIQRRVDARVEDNSVFLRAGDSLAAPERTPIPAEIQHAPAAVVSPAGARGDSTPQPPLDAPVEAVADDDSGFDDAESFATDSLEDGFDGGDIAVVAAGQPEAPAVEPSEAEAFDAADFAAVPDADFSLAAAGLAAAVDDDIHIEDLEDAALPASVDEPQLRDAMPEGVAAKLARLRQSVQQGEAAAVVPVAAPADAVNAAGHAFAEDLTRTDFQPVESFAAFAAEAELTAAPADYVAAPVGTLSAFAEDMDEEADWDDADAFAPVDVPRPKAADPAEALAEDLDASEAADAVLGRLDALLASDALAAPAPEPELAGPARDDDLARMLSDMAEDSLAGADTAEDEAAAYAPSAGLADEPAEAEGEAEEVYPSYALNDVDAPTRVQDAAEVVAPVHDSRPQPAAAQPEAAPSLAELVAELNGPVASSAAEDVAAAPAAAAAQPVLNEEPRAVSEKLQRARARVIKVRRVDLAPLAEGEVAPGSSVPVGETEEDVERLIKKAGDEMAVPEIQRRQAAIQHLKAAVAATAAERRAGVAQPGEGMREGAYRADLAKVAVRPVRPQVQDGHTGTEPADRAEAAPVVSRPAPLVLVSAQRVDRPAPAPAGGVVMPVRPRRVAGMAAAAAVSPAAERPMPLRTAVLREAPVAEDLTADAALLAALGEDGPDQDLQRALGDAAPARAAVVYDSHQSDDEEDDEAEGENIFHESGDFMDFAERLGATAMPELLEAAAAYATCVEKREHFTRPLLMRRLVSGELGEQISREDGLRSFGTLLREGRIAKVRRGQYALPEDSALLAEARKLAS